LAFLPIKLEPVWLVSRFGQGRSASKLLGLRQFGLELDWSKSFWLQSWFGLSQFGFVLVGSSQFGALSLQMY